MTREVWLRRCSSFEEEALADREFWEQFTPNDRVRILEEMRLGRTSPTSRR